jgi:Autochaperone Domain Type 1
MTGNSNLTSLTNSASTINFAPPTGDPTLLASYRTLTVGSYIGQGGLIALNTFLGGDGSPSD